MSKVEVLCMRALFLRRKNITLSYYKKKKFNNKANCLNKFYKTM